MSRIQQTRAGKRPRSQEMDFRETRRLLDQKLAEKGLQSQPWTSSMRVRHGDHRSNLPSAPDFQEE